jgi:hypothetical protein
MWVLLNHEYKSESPVIWTLGLFAMFAGPAPGILHNKPLPIKLLWPRSKFDATQDTLGNSHSTLDPTERRASNRQRVWSHTEPVDTRLSSASGGRPKRRTITDLQFQQRTL